MFRLQDQPFHLHVCVSGSNHHEADYYDFYCVWLKPKQAGGDKAAE